MKKDHLEAVWKKIEAAYLDERINSERCLRALLYQGFTEILGSDYLIFVEPSLHQYCPDLQWWDRAICPKMV